MDKKRIMITGAAGYIGAMLIDVFASRDDVEKIFAIDKDDQTDLTKKHSGKVIYLKANLASANWEILADSIKPEIIIHTAWQIRELYGRRNISWIYNIVASDKVFEFAFSRDYIKRLIHFSTIASYGAFATNTKEYKYKETDDLRETAYIYAEEKRICEEHLREKYNSIEIASLSGYNNKPMVMVLRPASITGPRLRHDINKFSLQSALSGRLSRQKGILNKLVVAMTSFMPSTKGWMRQYIHEDDVVDIVTMLALDQKVKDEYEIYNICPAGPVVLGDDMANALNKRAININVRLIRLVFSLFWHVTRGRVPTAPGVWAGYSYPIAVDGSKITEIYNYKYQYESMAALVTESGRYIKSYGQLEQEVKMC